MKVIQGVCQEDSEPCKHRRLQCASSSAAGTEQAINVKKKWDYIVNILCYGVMEQGSLVTPWKALIRSEKHSFR